MDSLKTDWAALLQFEPLMEAVPEDFMTLAQIAEMQGISTDSLRKRLKELMASGHVECRTFRVKRSDGQRVSTKHYRIVPGK